MAAWGAAGSAGEHREQVVEALGELGRGQYPHPRGGQLDRQRQAVQTTADLPDGVRVAFADLERWPHQLGSLLEEPHRVRPGQRRDRPAALALHAQRLAAGGEDGQGRAAGQEPFGEVCHRGGQVLAVVQHDQHGPAADVTGDRLGGILTGSVGHAELAGHRSGHDVRLGDGGEFHPTDAPWEAVVRRVRRGQRQPGFARAAWSGKRQQPVAAEYPQDIAQFAVAADQRRETHRCLACREPCHLESPAPPADPNVPISESSPRQTWARVMAPAGSERAARRRFPPSPPRFPPGRAASLLPNQVR